MSYFFKCIFKIYLFGIQKELANVSKNTKLCTSVWCLLSSQSMNIAWWDWNHYGFVIIFLPFSSEGDFGLCHYHTDSSMLEFQRQFCNILRNLSFLGVVQQQSLLNGEKQWRSQQTKSYVCHCHSWRSKLKFSFLAYSFLLKYLFLCKQEYYYFLLIFNALLIK